MDEAIKVKLEQMNTYDIFIDQFNSVCSWKINKFLSKCREKEGALQQQSKYTFNKSKHSLGQCSKVFALSTVAFLPLEKPMGKLIWSSMKPIYTGHLQFCDLAVRAPINMFSILFHFTFQTLFFPFFLSSCEK